MGLTKIIAWAALGAGFLFAGHAIAAPAAAPLNFEGAQWIWVGAENPPELNDLPKGGGFFRAAFEVTEKARVSSAELIITADNLWDLYLNGKPVGESDPNPNNWNQPKRFDVAGLLTAGINVLAVVAVNTAPGPAGLLVKLEARLEDGQQVTVATDGRWKTSEREEPNWQQPDFNDQGWRAARVLGDFGMKPWNKFEARAAGRQRFDRLQTRNQILAAIVDGNAAPAQLTQKIGLGQAGPSRRLACFVFERSASAIVRLANFHPG